MANHTEQRAQQRETTDESKSSSGKRAATSEGIAQEIMNLSMRAIDGANDEEAKARVEELRSKHPELPVDKLAAMLIQKKSIQAGTLGAATSGAAIIPGLGTLQAITVGAVADLSLTIKLQVELLLELAALYDHTFAPQEKQQALLLVAGIGAGAERLLVRGSMEVVQQFAERFVGRALVKAVPVLGVGVSASLNALVTYLVGQRAQAYFQLGPEAVGDWGASVRAITGVDERTLSQRVSTTATSTWQRLRNSTAAASKKLGSTTQAGTKAIRQRWRGPHEPDAMDDNMGFVDDLDGGETEAIEIPIINLDDRHEAGADAH